MNLLEDIYAYLRKTGLSKSYFGKLAVKNSAVVGRLEAKRPILVSTSDRLRAFMRDNPNGAPRRRGKAISHSTNSGNADDPAGELPPAEEQSERVSSGNAAMHPNHVGVASKPRSQDQTHSRVDEEPPPGGVH